MLGIDKVAHLRGAVDTAVMEGWGMRPSEVVEERDLPKFDDTYIFVQRYRMPPMPSHTGPGQPGREIVGLWAVGFASIFPNVESRGHLFAALERPKKKAYVVAFWPVDIFETWQSQVCAMADKFGVSAVVPMSTEIGMGLHFYDPNLTLTSVDTFYVRTLLF